jgi:hypothetical protein
MKKFNNVIKIAFEIKVRKQLVEILKVMSAPSGRETLTLTENDKKKETSSSEIKFL